MAAASRPSELSDQLQDAIWAISRSTVGTLRETLRGERITPPQYWILKMLEGEGPLPTSEIAQRLCVRPPTTTGLVDHLVRNGLVRRRTEPEDRRVVHVELTPRGLASLRAIRAEIGAIWAERLSAMPAARRRHAMTALREIAAYLVAEPPSAARSSPTNPVASRRTPELAA